MPIIGYNGIGYMSIIIKGGNIMPGFDGTGPNGLGPMTGGGFGRCNPQGIARQGCGRGRGRRGALNYRNADNIAQDTYSTEIADERFTALKRQNEVLENQITEANQKTTELANKIDELNTMITKLQSKPSKSKPKQ